MLNSSCSPGDRKMQERVGLEQQGWALDSKNVRFGKSSSPASLTVYRDDPDLYLKGFGFWGIQILFGSSVVGIGSVLFTLFMMFVFLSNRSTNLKRGNFFSWAANTGKTTYLKKKMSNQVICVNQLLGKTISYRDTCTLRKLWVGDLDGIKFIISLSQRNHRTQPHEPSLSWGWLDQQHWHHDPIFLFGEASASPRNRICKDFILHWGGKVHVIWHHERESYLVSVMGVGTW